jgi:hypothetical protein
MNTTNNRNRQKHYLKYAGICLILCNNFLFLHSQITLSGRVLDAKTNQPVMFASVYINGTTKGTNTTEKGTFVLKNVAIPCELVVSHISYNLKVLPVKNEMTDLIIELTERSIQLADVDVQGENLRKENSYYFIKWFFESNKWGQSARLLNDSVLIYKHYKESWIDSIQSKASRKYVDTTVLDFKWCKDSMCYTYSTNTGFLVNSKGPLLIELQLLGYRLRLDLLYFDVHESELANAKECEYLGLYYYDTIPPKNARMARKIDTNRKMVYYNSPLHFLRSLATQTLESNGFKIFEQYRDSAKIIQYRSFDIKPYIKKINSDYVEITSLKNRSFKIFYFSDLDDMSKDISKFKMVHSIQSKIYFTSDTCKIRMNGTTPDNNIKFAGVMGEKKIGATLPDDYQPEIRKQ